MQNCNNLCIAICREKCRIYNGVAFNPVEWKLLKWKLIVLFPMRLLYWLILISDMLVISVGWVQWDSLYCQFFKVTVTKRNDLETTNSDLEHKNSGFPLQTYTRHIYPEATSFVCQKAIALLCIPKAWAYYRIRKL